MLLLTYISHLMFLYCNIPMEIKYTELAADEYS